MKEWGQKTEKKLEQIRVMMNSAHMTSDIILGPRHMQTMCLSELCDLHAIWSTNGPVSKETMRHHQKSWSCVLRKRSRECTHKPCETCTDIQMRRKAATTREELEALSKLLAEHRDGVFADRRVYKYNSELSRVATSPHQGLIDPDSSVLCVMVDGMDQSKFLCPRNVQSSKLWDSYWRPQLGFVGALVHGVAEIYFILDPCLQKSSSTTVEILCQILDITRDILATRGIPFPIHLRLHCDNTSRENKNNTVLKFSNYLADVFGTNGLEFMEVGHTHVDLDQRFSVLGPIIAAASELETPEDFGMLIRTKYAPLKGHELHVRLMTAVRDWKAWTHPIGEHFGGHTGKGSAHAFRFVRYKHLSEDWQKLTITDRDSLGPANPDDIIALVKGFMRDTRLLQDPLLVRRAGTPLPDPASVPMLDMKDNCTRQVEEYRKTARVLDAAPWNLHRAAAWMQQMCDRWEKNEPGSAPPISFVFEPRTSYEQIIPLHDWCLPVQPSCKLIHMIVPKAKPKQKAKAKVKAKCAAKAKVAVVPKAVAPAIADAVAPLAMEPPEDVVPPAFVDAVLLQAMEPLENVVPPTIVPAAPPATPKPAAARKRALPPPPTPLGCSKCRHVNRGCGQCRCKARVDYSPTRGWYSY